MSKAKAKIQHLFLVSMRNTFIFMTGIVLLITFFSSEIEPFIANFDIIMSVLTIIIPITVIISFIITVKICEIFE